MEAKEGHGLTSTVHCDRSGRCFRCERVRATGDDAGHDAMESGSWLFVRREPSGRMAKLVDMRLDEGTTDWGVGVARCWTGGAGVGWGPEVRARNDNLKG